MSKVENNIKNNSSLFTNFVNNVINNPSPEVQKNFMDVSLKIAETIRKICEDEKLIFNVPYEGKKYWLVTDYKRTHLKQKSDYGSVYKKQITAIKTFLSIISSSKEASLVV